MVGDGKGVIEAVAVGGTGVLVGAEVRVGMGDSVTMNVEVGVGLDVAVLKLGTTVIPGVLVGTFGTHNNCPV